MYLNKYVIIILSLATTSVFGQVPQGINYQAVIRDAAGELLAHQLVDIEVRILPSPAGAPLYEEEFSGFMTDQFGLLNMVIGRGAAQGIPFFLVDWGNGQNYLELTISYDNERIRIPATPMQAVPYALVADELATPLWEAGGSNNILALGDRVGIGTTVPSDALSVQGDGHVGGSFTTEGAADAYLDLTRGTGELYTDWRIINDGGLLSMRNALDGFDGPGTPALSLTSSGRLALGDFTSPATQLHVRGSGSQRIRTESTNGSAGLDYYSNGADFRMANEQGRFVFRRSTNNFGSSTEIFDIQTDNTLRFRQNINMADQQIVNTADPSGPQHVVNRRYLEDYVGDQLEQKSLFPEQLSSEANNLTFDACANRCRTLTEGGFTNWGVPSLDQMSQFAGGLVGDPSAQWTSTGVHTRSAYGHEKDDGTFDDPPTVRFQEFTGRFTMRLNTGAIDVATRSASGVNCRCVR